MIIKRILPYQAIYVVACAALFANSLAANAILAGQASIDGSVTVTESTISFFDNSDEIPRVYNVDTGFGSFAGLTTPDSIANLTGGPVTGGISVIDFATFNTTAGLITFDLTNIDPGTGTLAQCSSNTVGNVCTPAGSPFTLTQVTADTVAFTLSLEGWAYTGTSATGETYTEGLFTGQQVPGTITAMLGTLSSEGSVTNSYSASFSSQPNAPEPGTFATLLIGGGMLGMGMLRRRRQTSLRESKTVSRL